MSKLIAPGEACAPALRQLNVIELELRLQEVHDFIKCYETHSEKLRGTMYTQGVLREQSDDADDVRELLPILLNALASISGDGVAKSLIEADLAQAHEDLGEGHQHKIKTYWGQLLQLTTAIESAAKEGVKPAEMFRATINVAAHILALFELGLIPAKALRQRLIDELRERKTTNVETDLPANPVTSKPLKAPSKKALKAYRAYTLGGMKQTDIAAKLKMKQYQISRYVSQVTAWIEAGNILPDLDLGNMAGKPVSVDADVIDMGRRQDGRTKRQRGKTDEHDD